MKPLAFIIITFNRPDDMLELAKNIASLESASELVEEIIIVNNASTSDYSQLTAFIEKSSLPFKYYYSPSNLGVSKGRNLAIAKSAAQILILLDDDCVLQGSNALKNILVAFEANNNSRPIALISFKVLYYDTLQMQKNALPHKKFDEYKDLKRFQTYYYAGGAHAIRKEVLDKIGTYPENFFYGMEEYDLSYRILNAGYSIVYDDSVVMLHKESPLGRKPKEEKIRMMWVNKTRVAWRYLPIRYTFSTAILWGFEYLRSSGFNIRGFFKGIKEIFHIPSSETRTQVSRETLRYLKKVRARLSY